MVPLPILSTPLDQPATWLVADYAPGGGFQFAPEHVAMVGMPSPLAPVRVSVFGPGAVEEETQLVKDPTKTATYLLTGVTNGVFTPMFESGYDQPFPSGSPVACNIVCAASLATVHARFKRCVPTVMHDADAVPGEIWWSLDAPDVLKAMTPSGVVKVATWT